MSGPAGAGPAPDGETLRALIREVLADLLPAAAARAGTVPPAAVPLSAGPVPLSAPAPDRGAPRPSGSAAPAPAGPAQPGLAHTVRDQVGAVETVSLRDDADLERFVLRLLRLFENPKHREALRTRRLRFTLAAGAAPGSPQPAHRVDKGAVTEAMVRDAAKAGARLVLGRRAVLTPLARDRARAAGVQIERER